MSTKQETLTAIDKSQFLAKKLENFTYPYAEAAEAADRILLYVATSPQMGDSYEEIPYFIWFLSEIRTLFAELAKEIDNEKLEVYL